MNLKEDKMVEGQDKEVQASLRALKTFSEQRSEQHTKRAIMDLLLVFPGLGRAGSLAGGL